MRPSADNRSPQQGKIPLAVIHVDLDGATDIFKMHGWNFPDSADPIFESGLRNALEFFDRNQVQATLFVIADSLENPRKRELLEEAVQRGHEIASHTLTHPDLLKLSREEKRREIFESRAKLESQLGMTVRGFRAPGYRIDREICEVLAEAGYEYDASAFPTKAFAERLDCPVERLKAPQTLLLDKPLLELPLPDHHPWPVPFNPSYALVIGDWYFRWGLQRFRRSEAPLVLLFHLIDFAAPLAQNQLHGRRGAIFTLSTLTAEKKKARCQQMLNTVMQNYRVTPTGTLLEEFKFDAQIEPVTAGDA